ncbi:MAG: DUF4199 domain-containing protein [Chitinophagales bacterium]|nr:DUF4199 domain-containing protein [Chitinophagales bacterium]
MDNLKEYNEKDWKPIAIKFGIIGSLASILVTIVLFFAGMQLETWAKWLSTLVMLIVLVVGIKTVRDSQNDTSFSTLFKSGILMSFIIALVSVLFFYIYVNFIDANFMHAVMEVSRQKMEAKGMTEEQIEQAMEMSSFFISPTFMLIMSFISTMIFGLLISIVSSFAFKKD